MNLAVWWTLAVSLMNEKGHDCTFFNERLKWRMGLRLGSVGYQIIDFLTV